jgi:hypothetical protein
MLVRASVMSVLALLAAVIWFGPGLFAAPELRAVVERGGNAVFLAGAEPDRQRAWVVSCPVPLRQCVARRDGAVLRLDSEGRPWIVVAVPAQSALEVRIGPFRRDVSALLHGPVPADLLALLDRQGAALVITDAAGPVQRLSLGGILRVVGYLGWLQRPAVRLARDARTWPDGAQAATAAGDPAHEARMEVLAVRQAADRT